MVTPVIFLKLLGFLLDDIILSPAISKKFPPFGVGLGAGRTSSALPRIQLVMNPFDPANPRDQEGSGRPGLSFAI